MRSLYPLLLLFLSSFGITAHAKNFIFFGDGEWTATANWTGGLTPWANGYTSADTITVTGTSGFGTNCTTNCPFGTLSANPGTLIIAAGGSLTFQNYTQFAQQGRLIVDGTMVNKTTIEVYPGSSFIINGTLTNQKVIDNNATITVNSGGVINNQLTAVFTNTGYPPNYPGIGILILNSGAVFNNSGTATLRAGNTTNNGIINNTSTLTGNATITGNLTNGGILAPGNSPGTYSVSGNYTAMSAAVHNFEIGGTATGSYDKLTVSGTVTLDGSLNVSLVNGFAPANATDIPIITGTIQGSFFSVTKPANYSVVYNSNNVVLRYLVGLPVKFTGIEVFKEANEARIVWRTANEENVSGYEVEKSADGASFRKIGWVDAAFAKEYAFIDPTVTAKSFYRIKSLDRDGKYAYSIIVLYRQGKSVVPLTVFPSPAAQTATVQHTSAGDAGKLVIIAADGRWLQTVNVSKGAQITKVDLSSIPAGSCLIRFENGAGQSETVKFIKQ